MNTLAREYLWAVPGLAIILLLAACSGQVRHGSDVLQEAHLFTLPSAQDGEVALDTYVGEEYVVLVFYEGLY